MRKLGVPRQTTSRIAFTEDFRAGCADSIGAGQVEGDGGSRHCEFSYYVCTFRCQLTRGRADTFFVSGLGARAAESACTSFLDVKLFHRLRAARGFRRRRSHTRPNDPGVIVHASPEY